jgi:hypothetical protein
VVGKSLDRVLPATKTPPFPSARIALPKSSWLPPRLVLKRRRRIGGVDQRTPGAIHPGHEGIRAGCCTAAIRTLGLLDGLQHRKVSRRGKSNTFWGSDCRPGNDPAHKRAAATFVKQAPNGARLTMISVSIEVAVVMKISVGEAVKIWEAVEVARQKGLPE